MTELQSNQPMRSCQSLVAPSINAPRQRVKVSYGVSEPLVIAMFYTRGGELQWVDLPTLTDVVFLSPKDELCTSSDATGLEQSFSSNYYVQSSRFSTQETGLARNDLETMNGRV